MVIRLYLLALLLSFLLLLSNTLFHMLGCSARPDTTKPQPPEFVELYGQMKEVAKPVVERKSPLRTMSISADGMPLSSFLRYVSDRTGVSVIAEERLDGKEITLDMKDQDVGLVLSVVARRLGVQVTRSGSLYYLGKLRNEDRGVMVRKVRRLNQEELLAAVGVLLSENGRAETYADGLAVIGDRVEVLERVAELLDGIESAPSDSWIVQLHVVSMANTFFVDAGLDVNPSAEIAATFAMVDVDDTSSQVTANATLQAVLTAERQDDRVSIVTEPAFVLLDGTTSEFRDATQTPVRIRTVSPEGTVTDAGFETVQTGTEIMCGIRELGANRARLSVSILNSSVAGSIENIPIVDEQSFVTEASVQAGGVYLLGSFERARKANQVRSITATARRNERDSRTMYVWAKTYRIAGPVYEGEEYGTGRDRRHSQSGGGGAGNSLHNGGTGGPDSSRDSQASSHGMQRGGPIGRDSDHPDRHVGDQRTGVSNSSGRVFGSLELPSPPSPSASQPRPFTTSGGSRTVDEGEGGATPSPEVEHRGLEPLQSTPKLFTNGPFLHRQQPPHACTHTPCVGGCDITIFEAVRILEEQSENEN